MPSQTIKSYKDLIVWQRSIQLSISIYKLTQDFPKSELYGLTGQLRRSSVSIPSNIAEGHGRLSTGEYRQFLGHARGSNGELQTQLIIAKEMLYGRPDLLKSCEVLSNEVGMMLNAMLASLNS